MENTNQNDRKATESVGVTETQKTYVVTWLYRANYGVVERKATSPEEAIKDVWNGQTDKIKYIVSEKEQTTILGGNN